MIDRVADQLRESRKYRDLCDETLILVATWACERNPSFKGATKAAKRKLHQVYGAFAGQVDFDQLMTLVGTIDPEAPRPVCEQILRTHVSTAERLCDLENVFDAIWAITGRPSRVLDLACGLNPFARPWMGSIGEYLAIDIDVRLAECVGKFFEHTGLKGDSGCSDLLVEVPDWQADVAFLFKALPCLDQQQKGAGLHILKQIRAPHIVVSFPTKSIGGVEKGMRVHYQAMMDRLAKVLGGCLQQLVFDRETYYIWSR